MTLVSPVLGHEALISGILLGDSILTGYAPREAGRGVWRGEVDIYGQDVPNPVRYGTSDPGREGCFRASLQHDRLWTVTPGADHFEIIPLEDLQFFEHNDFTRRLRELRFGKEKARTYHFAYAHLVRDVLVGHWGEQLPRVPDDRVDPQTGRRDLMDWEHQVDHLVRNHRYDILPVDDKTITVFRLGGEHIVIEPVVRNAKGRNEFLRAPLRDRLALRTNNSFPVPFRGDFHVYEAGGAYYFLTDMGRLYRAKSKGKDPADGWDVSAVWEDKGRPLLGCLHDVKAGKYYAFGTADKKDPATKADTGERFYFELAAKAAPAEYRRTSKAPKAVLEGFHEAYACAREIARLGAKK